MERARNLRRVPEFARAEAWALYAPVSSAPAPAPAPGPGRTPPTAGVPVLPLAHPDAERPAPISLPSPNHPRHGTRHIPDPYETAFNILSPPAPAPGAPETDAVELMSPTRPHTMFRIPAGTDAAGHAQQHKNFPSRGGPILPWDPSRSATASDDTSSFQGFKPHEASASASVRPAGPAHGAFAEALRVDVQGGAGAGLGESGARRDAARTDYREGFLPHAPKEDLGRRILSPHGRLNPITGVWAEEPGPDSVRRSDL